MRVREVKAGRGRSAAWLRKGWIYWMGRERGFGLFYVLENRNVDGLRTDRGRIVGLGCACLRLCSCTRRLRRPRGQRTRWLAALGILARSRRIIIGRMRLRRSIRTWIASTMRAK